MCQVNNSVTFSRKPIGSEDFLNRMIETLGITIDKRPKGRSCKMENCLNKKKIKKTIERH